MILAVTGHRPDKLWDNGYTSYRNPAAWSRLVHFAGREICARKPSEVISGMALGWDQAVAQACVVHGIPFIAALPFEGQDQLWYVADRAFYKNLLADAAEIVTVCKHRLNIAFLERDEYMVNRAKNLLALWNGSPGGTAHTVRYAEEWAYPVENVWASWEAYREQAEGCP